MATNTDVTTLPNEHYVKLVRRARDTFNKNPEVQREVVSLLASRGDINIEFDATSETK